MPGPNLPLAVIESAMNEFGNGVILIGGRGDTDGHKIYQLSSPNGTWMKMKQALKEKRSHAVSFLIPDEIVKCHG